MKEDVLKGYRVGADDYLKKPDSDVLLCQKLRILKRNNFIKSIESDEKEFTF